MISPAPSTINDTRRLCEASHPHGAARKGTLERDTPYSDIGCVGIKAFKSHTAPSPGHCVEICSKGAGA